MMTHCLGMPDGDDRRRECKHAEDAANKAVSKVFAILGVDIDNPKEVEQFRTSLRFGDQLRRAADKGFMTLIVVVVAALVGTLWVGLQQKLGG